MAEYVIMPKLGFNMDKGTLVRWIKKEGDLVKEQEVLFEIETDKTVMEVEAQTSGILRKTLVAEGEEVPVTLPIAIIGDRDDDISKMIDEAYQKLGKSKMTEEEPKAAKRISQGIVEKREIKPKKEKKEFKKISPGAQRKAKELGVEAQLVEGSGPGGVVIEKDILDYFQLKRETSKTLIEEREIEKRIPYTGIRKIIGDRLSQSKFTAPHIYFTTSVDMSEVIRLLNRFSQDSEERISINDFLVFTAAKVLAEQPNINCSLVGEEIVYHKDINIGVAVALEEGLIVPVVKNVNKKNLSILSKEIKKLIKLAREKKLMPDDYQGGTFTVSNLGMYEIESFTAIINPPEAAILAVGEIKKIPAVIEEEGVEKIEVRSLMKMTLSVDHRLIDGAMAANFLKQVKYYLEFPEQPVL
jgi:pyruvate dehydrogenase E2 component (dihydrolipoamide acetyltransferase)